MPLPNFSHLKRIASKFDTFGHIVEDSANEQTSDRVTHIFIATETEFSSEGLVREFLAQADISSEISKIIQVSVPNSPIFSREKFVIYKGGWPLHYRANSEFTNQIERKEGDNIGDVERIQKYLKIALEKSRLSRENGCISIGVCIVDPKSDSTISACGDSRPWSHVSNTFCKGFDSLKCQKESEKTQKSKNIFHPLNHASIECIKLVSEKNRAVLESSKRRFEDELPYLCTGYDAYLTHEPCFMCTMGFLHSRISRLYFLNRNQEFGGASKAMIHRNKKLNHRFRVYQVFWTDNEDLS